MADSVQHVRRTAKILAILATLWASLMAAVIWMAPVSHWEWQVILYTAVVIVTPVLQLVLIGVGAVRERSNPRRASLFYFGAVLLLAPELLMTVLEIPASEAKPFGLGSNARPRHFGSELASAP